MCERESAPGLGGRNVVLDPCADPWACRGFSAEARAVVHLCRDAATFANGLKVA